MKVVVLKSYDGDIIGVFQGTVNQIKRNLDKVDDRLGQEDWEEFEFEEFNVRRL